MIWLMSYAASLLRVLASKLDGMETVNHFHVQNDIHVYTMVDADPEDIAYQIKYHMGLYPTTSPEVE